MEGAPDRNRPFMSHFGFARRFIVEILAKVEAKIFDTHWVNQITQIYRKCNKI